MTGSSLLRSCSRASSPRTSPTGACSDRTRAGSICISATRSAGDHVRSANEGLIGILPIVAIFYLVVAVLVGASFVGAEYRSGTVENLLLWEPRRARVLLTKFVAGFGSSVVLTYLLLVWLTALLYLLAITRGTTQGVDGRFWIDVASTSGRGALMGGLFFVASMSVSLIARHTTAAVGVILGWFVVSNLAIELFAQWLRGMGVVHQRHRVHP